ncbi:MAG: ABC transporter substrate-binding protein [Kofleriaceae bacterium]
MLVGCDSPARPKPWRHAPDPTAEAARAPSSPALADVSSEAEIRAARKHTLRIHVDAEPGRLNPLVAPTVWGRRITLGTVFEPLIRYQPADRPGEPGRYAPRLARSWKIQASGLEIRIELEPGIKFHDGHGLSTSDVQFTLDAIRDPRRGVDHLRPLLEDVEATELLTPTIMNIRLKRPSSWVLRALAEIPILPMHVYDGSLLAGGVLVGSGPWKVASIKSGTIHLTRFDRYWGGPAKIADLEFVHERDAAVALKDAKRGDYDIIPALVPAHWPDQATSPGIAATFRPLALAPVRLRYLAFNVTRPPLDDPRVRHALGLLINRKEIAKHVFHGLARPALWPVWPGGFVHGAETPAPDLEPTSAGKLLDAAGWGDSDKDGIRDKDGVQLRLTMIGSEQPRTTSDTARKGPTSAREYLIDAARRNGVVIEMKPGGDSWVAVRVEEGKYDLVEMAWNGMVDADASKRLAGYSPRIDRTLDAMGAAWDPAERVKLAPELSAALAESWPIVGIVADAPQGLIHVRVKNVRQWDGWIDLTQLELDDKR